MSILRFLFGWAEFALVVWLMLGALGQGGWWIVGLVGYFIFSAMIGTNWWLMGICSFIVAIAFLIYGFWGALIGLLIALGIQMMLGLE